jgi:hypothetical protein
MKTLNKKWKKALVILLSGIFTLLTTAKAKPTISFSLPSLGSYIEQKSLEAMKRFSGKRVDTQSLQMIYFHDQTIAVVELGPAKMLLGCELIEIYKDEEGRKLLQKLSSINRPLEISFIEMAKLMSQCEKVDRLNEIRFKKALGDDEGYQSDQPANDSESSQKGMFSASSLLSGIIPGTKWCGTGDIAKDYYDLGEDKNIDRCCRTHDLCPQKVRPYQSRYRLNNNSIYTKSHCHCDDLFFECLKRTNTSAAQVMGSIYFNIVKVPCIEETKNGYSFRKVREGF